MIKSRKNIFQLFLYIAFPIHIWTIILFLRDFEWIANRSSSWDAIGVGAYGLLFSFIESCIIFLVVYLLCLLLPGSWKENTRISFMTSVYYALAIWTILIKTLDINYESYANFLIKSIRSTSHPYRVYLMVLISTVGIILISLAAVVFLFFKNKKFSIVFNSVMERISILSMIYIFMDIVGIVILIVRNS